MKSETDFNTRKSYLRYLIDYYTGQALVGTISRISYGTPFITGDVSKMARDTAIETVKSLYGDFDIETM